MARVGKIAVAQIIPPGSVTDDRVSAIRDALVAGTSVERYNRIWRLEGFSREGGRWLQGRVGFERELGRADLWDEQTKQFRNEAIKDGVAVRVCIALPSLVMAFQRTSKATRGGVTGAMRALLVEGSQVEGWRVDSRLEKLEWSAFERRVQRVTHRARGGFSETMTMSFGEGFDTMRFSRRSRQFRRPSSGPSARPPSPDPPRRACRSRLIPRQTDHPARTGHRGRR